MLTSDKPYPPLNRKQLSRIFSKVRISTEHFYKGDPCWEWTGFIAVKTHYGQTSYLRGCHLAHRVFYHWFVGKMPEGYVTDHLCRVKHCVNPAHLEAVTPAENTARIVWTEKPGSKEQTHCKQGHPFAGNNLRWEKNYVNDGSRGGPLLRKVCRACRNRRERERTRRLRQDKRLTTAISC